VANNRTTIFIIVLYLLCLCFSRQAHASHRLVGLQEFNGYNLDNASLASIYRHEVDNVWLEEQQLNHKAHVALEFIASASEHGLNPEHYQYKLLQQLDPSASKTEAQLYDLLLTDGLLKYISDIAVGRLDPAIVDPKWSIPRAPFDAAAFLQHALQAENFKESLDMLYPKSDQYRKLQSAVMRFQDHIDQGGWAVVPETPLLRPGDIHHNIPAIRERLAFEDNTLVPDTLNTSSHYDERLKRTILKFQRRYSLKIDGLIGPETLNAMNVSASARLQQIKINMERLRWLPNDLGKRYIIVNLANYRLTAIDEDKIKLDMRVIVGQTKRPTPSFASKMTHVVFNPYWNVPRKLALLDLLPRQRNNPDYFQNYSIRIFDHNNGKRTEIDPDSIDWSSINYREFPYTLRQDPGKKNALGRLKFLLPNKWSINLHDTPAKGLFNRDIRNFSSGCIRVEDPLALANFSLSGIYNQKTIADIFSSNDNFTTRLKDPLSVYAVYVTVWPNENEIIFSPDSYQRDQRMAESL
jgi:murein L,D-transpeptidase YcbB/YkuD